MSPLRSKSIRRSLQSTLEPQAGESSEGDQSLETPSTLVDEEDQQVQDHASSRAETGDYALLIVDTEFSVSCPGSSRYKTTIIVFRALTKASVHKAEYVTYARSMDPCSLDFAVKGHSLEHDESTIR